MGAEVVRDFDIQPIRSLEEVEGDWEIAPEGVDLFEGDSMLFTHGKCRYRQYTCARPPALKAPIEFDVELKNSALVRKTDNPHVIAKKWHLAKLGEYKCLVCITTSEKTPIHANATVFYHRPNQGKEMPKSERPAESFKKRLPPVR
jgi:hypothetical protein